MTDGGSTEQSPPADRRRLRRRKPEQPRFSRTESIGCRILPGCAVFGVTVQTTAVAATPVNTAIRNAPLRLLIIDGEFYIYGQKEKCEPTNLLFQPLPSSFRVKMRAYSFAWEKSDNAIPVGPLKWIVDRSTSEKPEENAHSCAIRHTRDFHSNKLVNSSI